MAKNVSVYANNARFARYPINLDRPEHNTPLHHRRMTAVAAHIRPGESVLDVGCNAGYFVNYCPPECTVHGVDLSAELVAIAATRLASAQVAPAEHLPFADHSIDVVTMSGVIEYVYDPATVLRELLRVARRAVVGTADHESGIWGAHRVPAHEYMVRSYTSAALTSLLESVGTLVHLSTVSDSRDVPQHYVFEIVHG